MKSSFVFNHKILKARQLQIKVLDGIQAIADMEEVGRSTSEEML